MAFSINRATLLGNIASDPELKKTSNDVSYCKFSLATNRSVKDESEQSGWRQVATFHRITVWGKLAENVFNRLSKGDKVFVEGRIDVNSYEDKDGNKRTSFSVVADSVIGFEKKLSGDSKKPIAEPNEEELKVEDSVDDVDDDIPF